VIPLAGAALAAGCGGGGGTTTTAEVDGATVFATNECGMCHHFTAAASEGDIGPDLDLTTLTAEEVELQVREGTGTMPGYKFVLTDEEIAAVVAYVVENRPA
jgi:mono/diheme cytochrome c family protein